MLTVVLDDDMVRIPNGIKDLSAFRRWVHSGDVPEKRRILYLDGRIWVDLNREPVFAHNAVKPEFDRVLANEMVANPRGRYHGDGVLLTNVEANLSCQPDGTFVSYKSLKSGRLQLIEGARGGYVELEGTPDMVLEVISTSSVGKDTEVLYDLYRVAGISEYWLVDARGDRVEFDIFRLTAKGYAAVRKDSGWAKSRVFGKSFRLQCREDAMGDPAYRLSVR